MRHFQFLTLYYKIRAKKARDRGGPSAQSCTQWGCKGESLTSREKAEFPSAAMLKLFLAACYQEAYGNFKVLSSLPLL